MTPHNETPRVQSIGQLIVERMKYKIKELNIVRIREHKRRVTGAIKSIKSLIPGADPGFDQGGPRS